LALAPIGGGAVEAVPMRMVDVILSIPAILFAIIRTRGCHELSAFFPIHTECFVPVENRGRGPSWPSCAMTTLPATPNATPPIRSSPEQNDLIGEQVILRFGLDDGAVRLPKKLAAARIEKPKRSRCDLVGDCPVVVPSLGRDDRDRSRVKLLSKSFPKITKRSPGCELEVLSQDDDAEFVANEASSACQKEPQKTPVHAMSN
jgi:hypothetical protein